MRNALAGGSSTPQQANACEEYCRARGRKISYGNARIPGQVNLGSFSKRLPCIFRGRKKSCRCAGRLRLKRAVWVRAPLRTSGARRRAARGCRRCRETKRVQRAALACMRPRLCPGNRPKKKIRLPKG